MRIAVTGASGLIGQHLVRALVARGDEVLALARTAGSVGGVAVRPADVTWPETRELVQSAEAIVHLAALSDPSPSLADPLGYNQVNALGTLNVLEAARRGGAHFVLASTQRIYAPTLEPVDEEAPKAPSEPYAWSKVIAETWTEMYARCYGVRTTTLRFFSVYGPGQRPGVGVSGVITILLTRALADAELRVDVRAARDFTEVSDVVRGILLALERPSPPGRVYNVATGIGTTMPELARLVVEVTGSRSPVVEVVEGEGRQHVANIARATRELGFQPQIPLRRGLELYAEWLQAHCPDPAEGAAHR